MISTILLLVFSGCSNSDLMIIENNNINDTNITNTTTYSSFKIVQLISNGSSSNINLSDYYNKTESDSLFLLKTTDTLTGNLTITDTLKLNKTPPFYIWYYNATTWDCYNGSGTIYNRGNSSIAC